MNRRHTGSISAIFFVAWVLSPAPAWAQSNSGPEEGFFHWDRASGDWLGVRSRLSGRGMEFQGAFMADFIGNISGGIARRGAYIQALDLTLTLDLEKLLGWGNTHVFAYGMGIHGRIPVLHTGSGQGIDNIAAPNLWTLYEIWLQKNLTGQNLSLLAGYYDLNSEFDYLESAQVFLNPSHGINPTLAFSGRNGPSIFPATTLGVRARWHPSPASYVQAVLLNGTAGDPENPGGIHLLTGPNVGVLTAVEIGFLDQGTHSPATARSQRRLGRFRTPDHAGKVALGGWFYTAKFQPLDSPVSGIDPERGNFGIYLIGESTLVRENSNPDQGLQAFLRFGSANGAFNRFQYFVGGGFAYNGPGNRSGDRIGAAFAAAFNGPSYRALNMRTGKPGGRAEWNLELTYSAQITPWLSLNPDLQFVIHPDTDPNIRNALAAGLRLEVSF